MFGIISTAIETEISPLREKLAHPEAGAYVSFEGWVRNHNDGKPVEKLAYEAFASLAQKEGEQIIQEALNRFQIKKAECIHRVGPLAIGEMAVWVGVTSAHREEAFQACRYIIDEVKIRLPIWKKEYYADGTAEWVNCQACSRHIHHSPETMASEREAKEDYYSRQVLLPEVGESGQKRLSNSRVLVIGAGGLGCPALLYLAGAGVGTLGICDPDRLQINNLHRQTLYEANDIGQPKAELAARKLRALNPFIRVLDYAYALSPQNAEALLSQYDWILDCTDNFNTKFLINDTAVLLKKPLIQASIYQYEGQLQLWHPHQKTACLRCHWPEIPDEQCVGTCAEVGVLGGVPGVLGTLQALETVKHIVGLPSPLSHQMLLMDLLTYQTLPIQRQKNEDCPLCSASPTITRIDPSHYAKTPQPHEPFNIDLSTFSAEAFHQTFFPYEWVDLRHQAEYPSKEAFSKETNYFLFCHQGFRSSAMVKTLRMQGVNNVFSVFEGHSAVLKLKKTLRENKKGQFAL